jgi:radical SAM superfamily enzyme YgiQ (UPF0313 family)
MRPPLKICLVNAPIAAEFAGAIEIQSDAVRQITLEPQLGILSLAAALELRGDNPEIVDLNRTYFHLADSAGIARLDDFAEFAAAVIAAKDAEVFGFTSICSSYPLTIRIAKGVKAIRPHCTTLFGGPQASVVDLQTLSAFPFVDFILRGEAEESLPWLLDELAGQGRMDRVPGLTYRAKGQPRRNPNAPVIRNLDALAAPAYHLTGELEGAHRAALEMGRGCPFACTFCSTNDFFRRNFRLRSPERILRDMQGLATAYGISDFDLIHDMFTVDRRRVVAFCEAMIGSGEKFTWSCSARTDCVDEPLLELMARAGCHGLFFGIETGSVRMQTIIDKHLDPRRAREIIDTAERLGIGTTVSLIIGFPEETSEDLRETVSMLMHSAHCPHSDPQLNLLAPLAETPLHWQYQNQLTLEMLCSDVSHQGEQQSARDMLLIREYPAIFPNFYLLPTPNLNRNFLLELREFALMGVEHFRWLLVALDHSTTGMLDLFCEWRQRRLDLWPDLDGFEMRRYYRSQTFRTDFLRFAREHPAGKHPLVQTWLEYEDAMRQGASSGNAATPRGIPLALGSELWWTDIPLRKQGSRMIELPCDIQGAVDALRHRSEFGSVGGRYYYVTREVTDGGESLDRISDWVASALRVCDGSRSMEQVVSQLAHEIPNIDIDVREYALMRLLEGLHADGLIEIFRPALDHSFSQQD